MAALSVMPDREFAQTLPIRVFVHLAHGLDAHRWEMNWRDGKVIGVNERLPYGYFRAADFGCVVEYSRSKNETSAGKLVRLGTRLVLGFDLVHAWQNRHTMFGADVIWTHTESQHFAILALFHLFRHRRRPKLIAQSVWLLDHWFRLSLLKRWLYRKLLSKADVLTVLSPSNLQVAKELFHDCRSELVLYGIRADQKIPPKLQTSRPIRVISLGNDEHRDWNTLISAVKLHGECELKIVSSRVDRTLIRGTQNISVERPADNAALLDLYAWADLVVLAIKPNLHASGITVLQEAALLGIPMICSDTGGLRAYFSDEEVRYVPAWDAPAICNAVKELAEDDASRRELASRAQQRMGDNGLSSISYVLRHVELSKQLMAAGCAKVPAR